MPCGPAGPASLDTAPRTGGAFSWHANPSAHAWAKRSPPLPRLAPRGCLDPSRARPDRRSPPPVLLVVVALVALTQGAADIPPATVLRILLDRLPMVTVDVTVPATQETIVLDIRLPRVIAAGAVGAALALSGASYQGVFRNPLAGPFLLGVASGAALGAAIAIISPLSTDAYGFGWVPVFAFAGALGTVVLVYLLATGGGRRGQHDADPRRGRALGRVRGGDGVHPAHRRRAGAADLLVPLRRLQHLELGAHRLGDALPRRRHGHRRDAREGAQRAPARRGAGRRSSASPSRVPSSLSSPQPRSPRPRPWRSPA